jgi:hypothetical protein
MSLSSNLCVALDPLKEKQFGLNGLTFPRVVPRAAPITSADQEMKKS